MSENGKVIAFPLQRNPAVIELQEEVSDLIYTFADRVSLAEAVGTLEVIKRDLIERQH